MALKKAYTIGDASLANAYHRIDQRYYNKADGKVDFRIGVYTSAASAAAGDAPIAQLSGFATFDTSSIVNETKFCYDYIVANPAAYNGSTDGVPNPVGCDYTGALNV